MEKIVIFIFSVIFLLSCCSKKHQIDNNTTDVLVKEIIQSAQKDDTLVEESLPLLIGGKQYRGKLGERVEVEKGNWQIPNDPVNCTIKDIDRLFIMTLRVDPENPEQRSSLENLELLHNLKELHIRGQNLDKVNFSPISSLYNLEELKIEGNISHLPDLISLEKLNIIEIKNAALENLEGICAPYVKTIEIETANNDLDSLAPLNNLLLLESLYISCLSNKVMKIIDMKNLPNLSFFQFKGGKIDMYGIEDLVSLEYLYIYNCEPYNFEKIGQLKNINTLAINLISDNPSIDFLKKMPTIKNLEINGYYQMYYWNEIEAFQVLDVSPLATIKTLDRLFLINLTVKNISSLDILENLTFIRFVGKSRLYDKNEKTRHGIMYEIIH